MVTRDYDAQRLAGPEDVVKVGTEEDEICGRVLPPDEDAPRGFRPTPCEGTMCYEPVENCSCHLSAPCSSCVDNPLVCDYCGEGIEA